MTSMVELLRARPCVVVLTVIAFGVAGCSEATRFADNYTYASASRTPPNELTGSVPAQGAAPAGRIEQSQLPPPSGAARPVETGVVGGGRGMSSFQPTPAAPTEVTGSVQEPRPPAGQSGRWSWDGGTAVTVVAGDTVESIARRHGVPASAIMQANGLASPAIRPGQRLVIPRYNASPSAPRPVASAPSRSLASTTTTHVVAPGETLSKLSRQYGRSVPDLAKANNIEPHATLKIGDRLVIPSVRTAGTPSKRVSRVGQPLAPQAPKAPPPPAAKQPEQTEQASVVSPSNDTPVTSTAKTSDGTPSFRWPVKGRVIAGFGPKPNGQQNDGINLAVPEGTPIKAAEDGVVAYAGNELKGYGNLVLIRHANGYVTAYAHAKELVVKRGEPVKRGQVIGKSGQTGNVDAPQLHFEVRKGPTPLDPMPLLSGG